MRNQKIIRIIVIVVVGFFVLGIVKDQLIKAAITIGAGQVTGAAVKIRGFRFGIVRPSVQIRGFQMYQPKGFPSGVLIDIPEIRVDYDPLALLQGKIHLPLVVLNLNKMVVIKDKDGNLNVDALKVSQTPDKKEVKEEPQQQSSKQLPMQIDVLKLNLGKVIVKDYAKGDRPPTVEAHDIGVNDKTYRDIGSAQELVTLVMVQSMGPAALNSAKIYGAATILGVGFLPAGVAGMLMGSDGGQEQFTASAQKAYQVSLDTLKRIGEVKSENTADGQIKGSINGIDVTVTVAQTDDKKTEVKVSARQMMLPKPAIAKGLLYEISESLQ